MPTLRIASIYKERKRTFAAELLQARVAWEQFGASLVVRFGQETADAIREASGRDGLISGRYAGPRLSREALLAAEKFQSLAGRVAAVWKKIRTPDCWFRETPGSVRVLETAGLSWRIVHEQCGGRAIAAVRRIVAAESPSHGRRASAAVYGNGDSNRVTCPRSGSAGWTAGGGDWRVSSARRRCGRKTCAGNSACRKHKQPSLNQELTDNYLGVNQILICDRIMNYVSA